MSKSKRSAKASRKPNSTKKTSKVHVSKPKSSAANAAQQPLPDAVYRPGTLYGTLFSEGSKDYIGKAELITKVAGLTGKSEKVVNFAYQVLKSKTHRSNNGRTTELTEGDKVKLVAILK